MKMCSKCGKHPQMTNSGKNTWCRGCTNQNARLRRRVIRSRAERDPFDEMVRETPVEQQIWVSALITGLRDASGDITAVSGNESRGLLVRRAQSWIGSHDFETVCHLAGFDPEFVKDAYEAGKFTKEHWKKYAVREEEAA